MTRHQFCIDIGESWRHLGEKLSRNVLRGWRSFAKRRVVLVQKLVIELIVDYFASAPFDFADIDQHAGDRIDASAEDKVGDVISPGTVLRARLRAKRGQIFFVGPA